MRPLFVVLAVQLVVAVTFAVLVATGSLSFGGDSGGRTAAHVNRFDGPAPFQLIQLKPPTIGPPVEFVLFDGEESPRGVPDNDFLAYGLRGSKVAAQAFKGAEAMILLDFVGDKNLSLPREGTSDIRLWARLRTAAA